MFFRNYHSKHLLVLKVVDVAGEAQVERLFKELSEELSEERLEVM